ncbi:MAG TPA: response regulator [Candidatus Xenobia bacterium]
MRIFYVEDMVSWRDRVVETYLAGHHVVVAGSVAEARERYRPNEFDAVLLDFELPDGTGADVARFIRSAGDGVPIIANSSSGGRNQFLLSLGANYAVSKSSDTQLEGVLLEIELGRRRG